MTKPTNILFPVGRLVSGSLYEGQTKDATGEALRTKSGPNAGQLRTNFFFAVAIPKNGTTSWSQTEWGRVIYETAKLGFPGGQFNNPAFAWKIVDGDSDVPNLEGRKPCEREGHPGHWVVKFSSSFAPKIYTKNGDQQLLDKDYVNPGDYISVYGNVAANGEHAKPGVYLNHIAVAFCGYGEPINFGINAKEIFKDTVAPAAASATPVAGAFNPAPAVSTQIQQQAPVVPVAQAAAVQPYPNILNTPAAPILTPKAVQSGYTYEGLIGLGFTDELLRQQGLIL